MDDRTTTLVVLGDGPKALYALEELCAHLTRSARTDEAPRRSRLDVTILCSSATPGTGAAYDSAQPRSLRLNVAADILDAPAPDTGTSFRDWVSTARPEHRDEDYPPRAVVGEYLGARWARMIDCLSDRAAVHSLHDRALSLRRARTGWVVLTRERGALDPVDEVLVATGHSREHPGALSRTWSSPVPLRPSVLPASSMLGEDSVPPGSRVAFRGAALTFIDAALVLTADRGGEFAPRAGGRPGLVHHRGPSEPSVLLPTARHGRLLDAKPAPRIPLPAQARRAIDRGGERLALLQRDDPAPGPVLDVVSEVAIRILESTGPAGAARRQAVEHTLATGWEPDLDRGAGASEAAFRRSIEIARGERPPGASWALGRAWAGMYRPLTSALRGTDADAEAWAAFRSAADVMERFAFGPPLEVAERVLAMVDSGAVDLGWVDAGVRISAGGIDHLPEGEGAPDVVVDAVIAPPGIQDTCDPLLVSLRTAGLVHSRAGRRGAVVERDGTAVAASGERLEGLALVGRPTEDHVIGHDTLNRHLHDEGRLWAERVARGAAGIGGRTTTPMLDLDHSAQERELR
ncbi:FAD/NAD(P)-binding protein [Brachybacterium sp. AOP43-C2-M15]|uniref:FAD/NAD(P)-binding protein n=1 Tax=Brachybacterium sp. AOP43-C2-M15 TaxID=3457661 RepID=UPI00403369F2